MPRTRGAADGPRRAVAARVVQPAVVGLGGRRARSSTRGVAPTGQRSCRGWWAGSLGSLSDDGSGSDAMEDQAVVLCFCPDLLMTS
jgi:hypothetical protein